MCVCTEEVKKWFSATVILTHGPLSCRWAAAECDECGTLPYLYTGAKKESDILHFDGFSCLVAIESRDELCEEKEKRKRQIIFFFSRQYLKCVTCFGQFIRRWTFPISAALECQPERWSYNNLSVHRFDLVTTNVFNLKSAASDVIKHQTTTSVFINHTP